MFFFLSTKVGAVDSFSQSILSFLVLTVFHFFNTFPLFPILSTLPFSAFRAQRMIALKNEAEMVKLARWVGRQTAEFELLLPMASPFSLACTFWTWS